MKITLQDRPGKLGIKYQYEKVLKNGKVVKEPFGSETYLTLYDSEGHEILHKEGHAECKSPDKFSRLAARKWAMISMFKRDDDEGKQLSSEDRKALMKYACPEYFGESRKEKRAREIREAKVDLPVTVKSDVTLEAQDKQEDNAISNTVINFLITMVIIVVAWLIFG